MEIYFTDTFKKAYKKLDNEMKEKVKKAISKLASGAGGKRLHYNLRDYFSIRIADTRVIYKVKDNKIMLLSCGHRKKIYR